MGIAAFSTSHLDDDGSLSASDSDSEASPINSANPSNYANAEVRQDIRLSSAVAAD